MPTVGAWFGGGTAAKVAVYVVFDAGVEISWLAAPPSDHDTNVYWVDPMVCGLATAIVRRMPTTPTTSWPVACGWPSSVTCSPAGDVAKRIVDVWGWMSRDTVCVAPESSRTSRWKR